MRQKLDHKAENVDNKHIFASQKKLQQLGLDGWLLWDFRRQNTLATTFLKLDPNTLLSRRFFYFIPKEGEPVKIVHAIEAHVLENLPGICRTYRTWQEYQGELAKVLKEGHIKTIAMEYSPMNAIPYLSKVDGGTLDLVRSFDVQVVSSSSLLQEGTSVLDSYQIATHLFAADVVDKTVHLAFEKIAKNLGKITEWDVQQFILHEFAKNGCITSDPPICAVNAHSANSHYCPSREKPTLIKTGDFILIDLWCKQDKERAIYADITRVGVASEAPTAKQQEIFLLVKKARDEAFLKVKTAFENGSPLMGWEVDEVARDIIRRGGCGDFFIHRLGHNIGQNDHGDGAHLDNFETQDQRFLIPGTCFSIEPGIYLPDSFGVRLEIDVLVHPDGKVQATGGMQEKISCLLSPHQAK
jgi:Xaa-Pro aminopeptidase